MTALLAGVAAPLMAQSAAPPPEEEEAGDRFITFAADDLVYSEREDLVVASGDVVLRRGDQVLTADEIRWDRRTGLVTATGSVRVADAEGNVAVADTMQLSEDLRDGLIENLLLVLADGGRLAASRGTREGGTTQLDRAIYSPCAVVDDAGCPQTPLWVVKAVRVRHDPEEGRVHYRGARLEAWGIPILALPRFSHPDSRLRNQSGLLAPDIRISNQLGFEAAIPYYLAIAPNKDLTATAHIYSLENPMLALEYRQLLPEGPLRVALRGTWSEGQAFDSKGNVIRTGREAFRGMIEGNGRFRHGGGWRSTFSTRITTDPNFPGFYEITYDNRFRSFLAIEKEEPGLYFGARAWYFQDLAPDAEPSRIPQAVPVVDVTWRPDAQPLGGQLRFDGNALGIFRADGQDMARLIGQARWDRLFTTAMGQRINLTTMLRSDFYAVSDSDFADVPVYAGTDGVQGRFIPLAALDVQWPLIGPLGRGTQVLIPRVQLVASPSGRNGGIPNEDSRAVELEDINLFALNRFPGFDRWEGGARVTYGVSWDWSRRGLALSGDIGQSYRLSDAATLFPDGTGLADRASDIVARFTLRSGRFGSLTQRLRLDKDSLAIRRSELDLSLGSERNFVTVGYLRFNRDIELEDLTDQEELRFGGQAALFRYWSAFASFIVDLTSVSEDPATVNDGFQPIRHRVGLIYADECFDFRFTWRRNYVDNLNAPVGSSFTFSFRLRTLG
ncbi:MAG: LPS assembly protein LptD [Sphingomonadaceae bacterium]